MEGRIEEEDDGSSRGLFAISIVFKLEGEAGFVLLRGTESVEKQEAMGPAHPHG